MTLALDSAADLALFSVPLAFLWMSFVVELTPGPNMTYLAVIALGEGRRAGLAAVAGVALGLLIVGVLAALGVATLVAESPILFQALRWLGVLYLLWLAYDIWHGDDSEPSLADNSAEDLAVYFKRGLITNLLNPKAAVFYIAMLPTFIDPARPVLGQTLSLSLAYVVVVTLVHAGIVMLAAAGDPFGTVLP